jgi:hypothetical protein
MPLTLLGIINEGNDGSYPFPMAAIPFVYASLSLKVIKTTSRVQF